MQENYAEYRELWYSGFQHAKIHSEEVNETK